MTVSKILTVDDAAAMTDLHGAAFPTPDAWTIAAFTELIAQPSTHAEGIAVDNRLQTLLVVQFVAGEAEILTLATAPEAQRRGLADKTLQRLEQRLRPAGLTKWLLDVAADNAAARAFYEKLGFQVDGQRANYYKRLEGTRVHAILMSKPVGGQITK